MSDEKQLVLGSVIRWDISHITLFIGEAIFSVIIAIIGLLLARAYKED